MAKPGKNRETPKPPQEQRPRIVIEEQPSLLNSSCLAASGKILVTLIIAYQVLNLMGKQFLKEYKQKLFIDESVRRNVMPSKEPMVYTGLFKTLTVYLGNCYTIEKLKDPLVKDTNLIYDSSQKSKVYNFSLDPKTVRPSNKIQKYDCLLVDLTSHSNEIKYVLKDADFTSDLPVEKQKFQGKISNGLSSRPS